MTFRPDAKWSRGRVRDGAIAISPTFFQNLRGGILTLFTTRNLRESERELSVDVLVAGAT